MTYTFDSKKLIQLRKAQFWTQEDLSAASDVSVRTIQRIEREGGGSLETWKALAAAFDVAVEAFQLPLTESSNSVSEKRLTFNGTLLGIAGGFLGCGISLGSIMHTPPEALNLYVIVAVYAGFISALCFMPSVWIWRRTKG